MKLANQVSRFNSTFEEVGTTGHKAKGVDLPTYLWVSPPPRGSDFSRPCVHEFKFDGTVLFQVPTSKFTAVDYGRSSQFKKKER